jgi:hypothetical protein
MIKLSFSLLKSVGLALVLIFSQTNLMAGTAKAKKKKEKRVILSQVDNNLYKLKIYFNFENPFNKQTLMYQKNDNYVITLPIPDKIEPVSLEQSVVYRTSLSVNPKASYLSMRANGNFVKQFQMLNVGTVERVKGEIPVTALQEGYNQISINILQKPIKDIEGFNSANNKSAPAVWTQIDLQHSYIELTFKLKPFEEEVRSIYKFMFDNKNLVKGKINFVLSTTPSDEDFQNYAFMANIIGNILGFRALDFSISTKIQRKMNNVIIATRDKIEPFFKDFKGFKDENSTLKSKMKGNINLIRNPKNKFNGILLITGDNQKEIMNALIRLTEDDIQDIEEQNLVVSSRKLPEKAKPFTAPKFMQLNKKYTFKDLDIPTQTLAGPSSHILNTKFKLYPGIKFDEADSVIYNFNYIVSNSHLLKPVFNIFMNNLFVAQGIGKENLEDSNIQHIQGKFSAKSLTENDNKLTLEVRTYPRQSSVYEAGMIQTTLKDDSFIILPRGHVEAKFPSLNYYSQSAFPFSIYPDLQRTAILITDFNAYTIASAMQIAFQLGEKIGYPGYYLTITYDINKVFDKDIIVLGNQIKQYEFLYKNAPIKFIENGIVKETDVKKNGKFVTKKKIEHKNMDKYVVVQTYQSPFNHKRIVFEISSTNPESLEEGTQTGLTSANMGIFKGDVWLYNTETEKSKSFRFKRTYKVKNLVDNPTDEDNEDDLTVTDSEDSDYDSDVELFLLNP